MGMKLHVGNLQSSITKDDLVSMFGRFGGVTSIMIFRDAHTGISRRFGSVEMATDEAARNAISNLNLTQQDGRTMIVSKARAGLGES